MDDSKMDFFDNTILEPNSNKYINDDEYKKL